VGSGVGSGSGVTSGVGGGEVSVVSVGGFFGVLVGLAVTEGAAVTVATGLAPGDDVAAGLPPRPNKYSNRRTMIPPTIRPMIRLRRELSFTGGGGGDPGYGVCA